MKRYCIVPNTFDQTQLSGEFHWLDLGSIGTGAGAGYYALVLCNTRDPFPVEFIAQFPHLLDSSNTLAGSVIKQGVTPAQLMSRLTDAGLLPTHSPYKAASLLGALHAGFLP